VFVLQIKYVSKKFDINFATSIISSNLMYKANIAKKLVLDSYISPKIHKFDTFWNKHNSTFYTTIYLEDN